jgi:hypothetical protein
MGRPQSRRRARGQRNDAPVPPHDRVLFEEDRPVGVERLGIALEAHDLRGDNSLDVCYGAADRVVAVARVGLPSELTSQARADAILARS